MHWESGFLMRTEKYEQILPKVYLIDDDPVITFLLTDLVESVNLPYVVFDNATSFLQQDLSALARKLAPSFDSQPPPHAQFA